jgi:hypothetical protein
MRLTGLVPKVYESFPKRVPSSILFFSSWYDFARMNGERELPLFFSPFFSFALFFVASSQSMD